MGCQDAGSRWLCSRVYDGEDRAPLVKLQVRLASGEWLEPGEYLGGKSWAFAYMVCHALRLVQRRTNYLDKTRHLSHGEL